MKNKLTTFVFILLSILNSYSQNLPATLANKTIFKGEFPLIATFRGNNSTVATYNEFAANYVVADSHIPDLLDINFFFDTTNAKFAKQLAAANPDRLFLQAMQANSGVNRLYTPWPTTVDRIAALPISFPGHWMVKPPTKIIANISANSTNISVTSNLGYNIGSYMPLFPDGCPAMIIETDLMGVKNWNHYEYVYVTAINGNTLTVTRSYRDSPAASAFTSGKAVIAPIIMNGWNEPPAWMVNFSASAPKDANGKSAAQVLIDALKLRFTNNGPLSNFSGIDFASSPFVTPPSEADYNLDGVIDGPQQYYDEVNDYLKAIKAQVNPDFLILAGNTNVNYISSFNGLNNEGLVAPNDPWRNISDAVNANLFSFAMNTSPHATIQLMRIQDNIAGGITNSEKWLPLTRMGNGYACCLGMAADVADKIFSNSQTDQNVIKLAWIELFKGVENQEHWLGQPVSEIIRIASKSPSLMGTSITDWTNIMKKLTFQNGTMAVVNNELVLTPNSNPNHNLTINLDLTQTNNLTILFDVISGGPLTVNTINSPVVSVPYATGSNASSYYTKNQFLTNEYYWRNLDPTTKSCSVTYNFKGTDPIRFRSMSAHEVAPCMVRSFEHGVVLVNPSLQDVTFDLTALLSKGQTYARLKAPTLTVGSKWQVQNQQTLEMNSGANITDPTKVIVPALNALFLKSQPIATGINEEMEINKVLMVYPNPSSGILNITSSEKIKTIAVFNLSGQIIFEKQILNGSKSFQFDLSSHIKGMYFVKITNEKNESNTKKIIFE